MVTDHDIATIITFRVCFCNANGTICRLVTTARDLWYLVNPRARAVVSRAQRGHYYVPSGLFHRSPDNNYIELCVHMRPAEK